MVDEVPGSVVTAEAMYATTGRPSIPPEKLLRAQLLRMLYSMRSERLLMEEIDYVYYFRAAKACWSQFRAKLPRGATHPAFDGELQNWPKANVE